jgi:hypothetical protein
MRPSFSKASARQRAGEPSPVLGRDDNYNNRPRTLDAAKVEREIGELVDRSTRDLRRAWRQLHRTELPAGLSRDLITRALAHQLQERIRGGAGRALRRRLQSLAGVLEKGGASFDPSIVLKTGTTLVRQWRGHTHIVRVHEDGFEYEGQRYRSLTVIAERITGAHWSGPRFFGLMKSDPVLRSAPKPADDAVGRQRHTAEHKGALCDLHPQILRGGAGSGIQFAAGAARSLRGVHQQPTPRRRGVPARGF